MKISLRASMMLPAPHSCDGAMMNCFCWSAITIPFHNVHLTDVSTDCNNKFHTFLRNVLEWMELDHKWCQAGEREKETETLCPRDARAELALDQTWFSLSSMTKWSGERFREKFLRRPLNSTFRFGKELASSTDTINYLLHAPAICCKQLSNHFVFLPTLHASPSTNGSATISKDKSRP